MAVRRESGVASDVRNETRDRGNGVGRVRVRDGPLLVPAIVSRLFPVAEVNDPAGKECKRRERDAGWPVISSLLTGSLSLSTRLLSLQSERAE